MTSCTAALQAALSFTISWSLLKLKWCHSTISSSATLFSCPQSFPASRSFPVSWLFASGGHSIEASASAISPSNEYLGFISFRIDWFDLPALQGTLKSLLQHQFKSINSLVLSLCYGPTLTSIHDYWKDCCFDYMSFVGKVMSLLFNMLSRFIIIFLPRSCHLLISWLQLPSAVTLESKKEKSVTASTFPPSICHEVMKPHAFILVFWTLSFKPAFSLSTLDSYSPDSIIMDQSSIRLRCCLWWSPNGFVRCLGHKTAMCYQLE